MFKKSGSTVEEIWEKLQPFVKEARLYHTDPQKHPLKMDFESMQYLELLHDKLTEALYNIKYGEIDEKLAKKEIDLDEWKDMKEEAAKHPYRGLI